MTPPPTPTHTHTHSRQNYGVSWTSSWLPIKCSNSAKILAENYWYHTQCVSERLDHKTKNVKNCWKKINYFPLEKGGGVLLHGIIFFNPSLCKCYECIALYSDLS